jgi:F-type H+-transporting ATPase subunit epsilon
MTMEVELVSPERILWSGDAEMVVCRTTDGDIAFLSNHAPFIGALGIGVVKIVEPGGHATVAAVHGGFVEVSHNKVTLLSDVAELAPDIDVARAREAKERAEAALRSDPSEENDAAVKRAAVRLEVASAA